MEYTGRNLIAWRAGRYLKDGELVNLGIGIPTMVSNFIPDGCEVLLESENGIVGIGGVPEPGKEDRDIIDAAGAPATVVTGGAFIDSAMSFGLLRGGHVDVCILGGMQVAENGDLASWVVPGKAVHGMGGGMDVVVGAKKVIIVMEHCTKKGEPKILHKCTYPLTAVKVVDTLITELCVIEFTEQGPTLTELAPGVTVDEVLAKTEADLIVPEHIACMTDA